MLERHEIAKWRHRYLRKIKKYREACKKIIYTDETWVNAGHVSKKSWQDTTVKLARDAFLKGLSTGSKNPSGKGERFIVTHAGGDNRFVPNAELIFKGSKGSRDYHKEMNSDVYEKWFEEKLLPNIPENSVIVLDNASYHSAKIELVPSRGWRKNDIQDWLDSKQITWRPDMIINELLELVVPFKHKFEARRIDELAKKAGHEVLRTPLIIVNSTRLSW